MVKVVGDPSLGTYWAQDIRGLTLCLDSAKFRNQHKHILPLEFYIKSVIWIIESKSPVFVCFHMIWVPTALYYFNLI